MHRPDVIVVGGGPAGSAAAFHLARAGANVVVMDRARFPRSKPCAECLSMDGTRLLHEMGVLDKALAAGAAELRGMRIRAPNGATMVGDFGAVNGSAPYRDRSIAVRREVLDTLLLEAAAGAGARIMPLTRVTDVVRDNDRRTIGVRVAGVHGDTDHLAPIVIGADGLRSVVARRLGLARPAGRPRRFGLVAHYEGVSGLTDYGEMHVEHDGFVGIADVGGGITTVAMVVPASRARDMSGDRAGFMEQWLARRAHLVPRFARARRIGDVTATGPFAARTRRPWAPGAALVGDAAAFFDPFTGEGIYTALSGGQMLASFVLAALEAGTPHAADDALAAYAAERRTQLRDKWRVERAIAVTVGHPALINRAARALASRKELANLLVGVTGHYVPPQRVLDPRFLFNVFAAPIPQA